LSIVFSTPGNGGNSENTSPYAATFKVDQLRVRTV